MDYILKTAPATEPITLNEVKANLHIDSSDDDSDLTRLIVAAREHAETVTRRALMPQTWIARSCGFPGYYGSIRLPYPPIQSVSSVKYYDRDGVLITLDALTNYQVSGLPISGAASDSPAVISLRYGETWPDVQLQNPEAVLIEFVCGYADATKIPADIKEAMHLMVGHWYANKEDSLVGTIIVKIPNGAETLLFRHRDLEF